MKKQAKIAAIVIAFLLLGLAFSAGFLYSTFVHQKVKQAKGLDFSLLKEAIADIDNTFYEKPSRTKLIDGAITGVIESLGNPYASYYPPKEYEHFQTSMNGNYSGIGIVIGGKKGKVEVLKVFSGSPASKKGLKQGEMIVAIDGRSAKNMDSDAAADLIRGPENTSVRLTLQRANKKRTVAIIRKRIDFPNIESKTFGKTGYISMHFFSSGAGEKLKGAIINLQKKGIKNLILDLRDNPGGQLNEAVDVASLFIDKGIIVKTRDKEKKLTVYSATGGVIYEGELVMLINKNTASASEIVSGAVQDRHRGKVVGVKSFGKGTVQQVVPLSNSGALVIPSETWLTPGGRDISKKGIQPDIIVKDNSKTVDKQFEKAKSLLK